MGILKNCTASPQKSSLLLSRGEKLALFLAAGVLIAFSILLSIPGVDLSARSTPTTYTTPPLFGEGADTCNLGLIKACNDSGEYVAGPESILKNWVFSSAIPWWISFFLILAAGVAVLMIMGGGIMILVGAEGELRKKGIQTIIWALIGLVIALFAFVIVSLLENIPFPGSTAPPPVAAEA